MESVVLYKMDNLHCDKCLSLPMPPVYHCVLGHFHCSKCCDSDTKQCTINNCKQGMHLCKLGTFLLTRMELICPNDKSHGCYTSLPIEDFTTHVEQCSHSPPQHTCTCPCCGDNTCVDIEALKVHFEIHRPTEVAPEQSDMFTLAQGHNLLLKLKLESCYLLLKFEGDSIFLQHMWWDPPRYHELHFGDLDNDWGFTGAKTSDIRSTTIEQYLQLPLISPSENITVALMIGGSSNAKKAVLNIDDLPDHHNLPKDAAVQVLICLICEQIVTNPVNHCTEGHTLCLLCSRGKVKMQKDRGDAVEEFIKCPYCTREIMRCRVGSYILRNSELGCPNRGAGCRNIMPIHEFETHVDNCKKLFMFTCPVCGLGCDDLGYLSNHFVDHRPKGIKYMESTMLIVWPGFTLVKESFTDDYFMLIFEDNRLCLQHMGWGEPQSYFMEFGNLGGEWSFHGQTLAVEKFPKLSAGCLKIPSTVLNPRSSLPIPINLEIRHEHEDYMHDEDDIADLVKKIKRGG